MWETYKKLEGGEQWLKVTAAILTPHILPTTSTDTIPTHGMMVWRASGGECEPLTLQSMRETV